MWRSSGFDVCCLTFIFSCSAAFPSAAQSEWKPRKEKEGVQVFFRAVEGTNVKEMMIKARVEGTLSAAVALLSDIERAPEWMDQCAESRIINRRSPTDYTYYQLIDFPWPFADREYVMRCRISQDPATMAVYFRASAEPEAHPPVKGNFRIQKTNSQWKIEPDGPEHLRLEYQLKTDPGDALPAWLVNIALDKGAVKTVRFMREAILTEPYVSRRLAFVKDPVAK